MATLAHPFFRGLKAPLHISHRGGAALYPENTLVAFTQAVTRHHTDMLELDVSCTRDGEIVVAHDLTVDRCTDGSGPIAALTCAQVQALDAGYHFTSVEGMAWRGKGARIPRFVEVLAAFPGLRINVDLKDPAAVDAFVALVQREQAADRLCIGADSDATGAALAAALPEACHFFPRDALAAFVLGFKGGETVDDPRYTVLDMPLEWENVTLFDRALANEARARGKWINVWTVDDPSQMRSAIAHGVGGVMTDRPDLLRAVLDGTH
jgi:glycerophosphoryl diester phosphodiesterase